MRRHKLLGLARVMSGRTAVVFLPPSRVVVGVHSAPERNVARWMRGRPAAVVAPTAISRGRQRTSVAARRRVRPVHVPQIVIRRMRHASSAAAVAHVVHGLFVVHRGRTTPSASSSSGRWRAVTVLRVRHVGLLEVGPVHGMVSRRRPARESVPIVRPLLLVVSVVGRPIRPVPVARLWRAGLGPALTSTAVASPHVLVMRTSSGRTRMPDGLLPSAGLEL